VGGPDLKIIPITLNPLDSSTMRMLTEDLPGGIKNVRAMAVRDYTESIRLTSANIGAISYGSASTVMGQRTIRTLPLAKGSSKNYVAPFTRQGKLNTKAVINNSYPLSRRISIVIRRDGTTDELAGVAYANLLRSKQGQKIVEQQGFVPLF
jgi:phosphate transport system substrate-binding protein